MSKTNISEKLTPDDIQTLVGLSETLKVADDFLAEFRCEICPIRDSCWKDLPQTYCHIITKMMNEITKMAKEVKENLDLEENSIVRIKAENFFID